MSVVSNFGVKPCFLRSLRISRTAARLLRRRLNQHVENLAFVIDGAPQVHPLAGNPDHHLVQLPPVARAWAGPPQLSCDPGPELQNPAPHRLIGNLQAALGEEFLNVAVAQCESGYSQIACWMIAAGKRCRR